MGGPVNPWPPGDWGAMTNTLGIDFAGDQAEMAADMPAVLTWGAQTITGTAGVVNRQNTTEDEGVWQEADLEWIGKVSGFTDGTLPEMQVVVAVGGVNYAILQRTVNEDGDVVRFRLERR